MAITLKDWAVFLSCVKKSQSRQSRIGMEAPKELRLFPAFCPSITRVWPSFSSWVVIRTTGLISQFQAIGLRKRRKAHLFKETSLLSHTSTFISLTLCHTKLQEKMRKANMPPNGEYFTKNEGKSSLSDTALSLL